MSQRQPRAPRGDSAPAVLLYICCVAIAAALLMVAAAVNAGMDMDWLVLSVLAIMSMVSFPARGKDLVGKATLSFASIIILSSVALLGPFGAALVGAVSPLGGLREQPLPRRVFNIAMNSLLAGFAGLVYLWVGGAEVNIEMDRQDLLVRVGIPLIAADLAMCLLNAFVLSGVMKLTRGIPVRRFVAAMLTSSGPAYVGYGLIGYLFAILWIPAGVGPFSALLVLSPLFVARWAFVQYGDENNAHERTLNALVAAVETKDARTRGHSERVAKLCDLIAGAMGLNHTDTASLRYAGMLHDVGILSVPSRILRKVDDLSDAELGSIRQHPAAGAEIVRDIQFLKPALNGIEHHHERFDGRGYPAGLAGDDIPLFARIVAVADAFESLTTSNAGRAALPISEALDEIERRSETQFDPVVVAALSRGLSREPWLVRTPDLSAAAGGGRGYDHDDPSQSDAMAGGQPCGAGPVPSSPTVDGGAW
jgi:HD-GYP domain-containing protein (c-di-GMP phosphodiesterase class II)